MRTDYPRNKRDLGRVQDLLAGAFAPGHAHIRTIFGADFSSSPSVRPEYVRIVRHNREVVASTTVYVKDVRIGRSVMGMGGLGFVCCNPKYRGRGYASHCVKDCQQLMARKGLQLSFLFGIDKFYPKFGYVGCLPSYKLKTAVAELTKLKNSLRVQPFEPRDYSEVLRLYEAAAAHSPGSVLRSLAHLRFAFRRGRFLGGGSRETAKQVLVFREKKGKRRARAYLIWRDNTLWEAGLEPGDEAAAEGLWAYMRDRRKEALEKEVVLANLSPAHPLWQYGERFNHGTENWFSWTGGGMGWIVDVKAFLERLGPELEGRLNAAGLDAECRLHLAVDGKDHFLNLGRGHLLAMGARETRVLKVTCSRQALLQMALGCLPWQSVPRVKAEGERSLIGVLFPESFPVMYRLDHF